MNNLYIRILGCLIAGSLSLMATGPRVSGTMLASAHNEIVAIELPPYYTNQHQNGGMAFEIVTAALNTQKETATLTTYPIQKMVNYYLTQEKVLGAIGVAWNLSAGEKKSLIGIPLSIVREHYYYYKPLHPKGIAWGGKLSNLKGLRYGDHEGSDTAAYTKAGIEVVKGRSLTLFQKLKEGGVDFIGEPQLSGQAIIEGNFAADKNQFGVMEPSPEESLCMIFFNRQNPDAEAISKKFKKGVTVILNNGQYQAIIEKYEGKNNISSGHVKQFKTLWEKELIRK